MVFLLRTEILQFLSNQGLPIVSYSSIWSHLLRNEQKLRLAAINNPNSSVCSIWMVLEWFYWNHFAIHRKRWSVSFLSSGNCIPLYWNRKFTIPICTYFSHLFRYIAAEFQWTVDLKCAMHFIQMNCPFFRIEFVYYKD